MKFKVTVLFFVLFLFSFISPVYSTEYNVEDLYREQIKFTSVVCDDVNNGSYGGKLFEIKYVTNVNTGKLHFQIHVDNVLYGGKDFEVAASGYNTGYFYVSSIRPDGYGAVKYRHWDGFQWIEYQNVIFTIADVSTVGLPPTEDAGNYSFLQGAIQITEPPYDYFYTDKNNLYIWYRYGLDEDTPGNFPFILGVNHDDNTLLSTYSADGYKYYFYRCRVHLDEGENTVSVNVNDGSKTISAERIIVRTIGIIDEDGDGIDDLTGLPIGGDLSELTPEGAPVLPENATIFDYVKYGIDSIIYVFAQFGLAIKGLVGGIGDVGKILTGFFSFMPQPFTGIIIIGMLIAIILRIFGR